MRDREGLRLLHRDPKLPIPDGTQPGGEGDLKAGSWNSNFISFHFMFFFLTTKYPLRCYPLLRLAYLINMG